MNKDNKPSVRLTGRTRYRKSSIFENIVLQVEEESVRVMRDFPSIGQAMNVTLLKYRDAKFEDLATLQELGVLLSERAKQLLDLEDEWLTGETMHRPAFWSDRVVLYVEVYESILTNSTAGYRRAKPVNITVYTDAPHRL